VRAGRLNIILPQWRSADAPVHALYQRNRYMAPRVRALLDFLIKRFAEESSRLME
jgi:DNA-binding transcriptional LysR family regulator